ADHSLSRGRKNVHAKRVRRERRGHGCGFFQSICAVHLVLLPCQSEWLFKAKLAEEPRRIRWRTALSVLVMSSVSQAPQRAQGTSKIFAMPPFSAAAWAAAASLRGIFRLIGMTNLPSRTASAIN